jgi:hypothetical protein
MTLKYTAEQRQASRAIKLLPGNGIKVLLAMGLLGGIECGNQAIKQMSGLSYPTIKSMLEDHLAFEGYVTKLARTNGWQLTSLGAAVIMATGVSEKFLDSVHSSSSVNDPMLIDGNFKTTTSTKPSTKNLHSPDKYFPDFNPEADLRPQPDEAIKALALAHGIFDPTATELASLVWVTDDYIKAWAAMMSAEGTHLDIGLAIYRIRQRWKAPELDPNTGHYIKCKCQSCGFSRMGINLDDDDEDLDDPDLDESEED